VQVPRYAPAAGYQSLGFLLGRVGSMMPFGGSELGLVTQMQAEQ